MQHDDMEKAKIAGVVALVGAAVGAGLALGVGLRLFSTQGELPPPSTL